MGPERWVLREDATGVVSKAPRLRHARLVSQTAAPPHQILGQPDACRIVVPTTQHHRSGPVLGGAVMVTQRLPGLGSRAQ